MRYPRTPVAVHVAGQTINTFATTYSPGGSRYITIPINALRKLVAAGGVSVRCRYHYTDDYAFDAATKFGAGEMDPAKLYPYGWDGASAYLREDMGAILTYRHSNECYAVAPIEGTITVTERVK